MNFRTDLTIERKEIINTNIRGVKVKEYENDECKTIVIDIDILPFNGWKTVLLEATFDHRGSITEFILLTDESTHIVIAFNGKAIAATKTVKVRINA